MPEFERGSLGERMFPSGLSTHGIYDRSRQRLMKEHVPYYECYCLVFILVFPLLVLLKQEGSWDILIALLVDWLGIVV